MITHTEPNLNAGLYSFNPPAYPFIADLNYPREIVKQIKAMNKAWDAWVESDTHHITASMDAQSARRRFEDEIIQAARNDLPRPEIPDFTTYDTETKYRAEIAHKRRAQFDAENTKLEEQLTEHRAHIAQLAIAKAQAGKQQFKQAIDSISQALADADTRRQAAYDGLTMMAKYAQPETRYTPNFGLQNMWQLPRTDEPAASNTILTLEHFLKTLSMRVNQSSGHAQPIETETE